MLKNLLNKEKKEKRENKLEKLKRLQLEKLNNPPKFQGYGCGLHK